jgi:hypothetical protein
MFKHILLLCSGSDKAKSNCNARLYAPILNYCPPKEQSLRRQRAARIRGNVSINTHKDQRALGKMSQLILTKISMH